MQVVVLNGVNLDVLARRDPVLYGGLAAQIVTPVVIGDRVAGIVSVHQLDGPRAWTAAEVEACTATAAEVGELL